MMLRCVKKACIWPAIAGGVLCAIHARQQIEIDRAAMAEAVFEENWKHFFAQPEETNLTGEMDGDLGSGAATNYDVLELRDGMTIAELTEQIALLPLRGIIVVPEKMVGCLFEGPKVRLPIMVTAGGKTRTQNVASD